MPPFRTALAAISMADLDLPCSLRTVSTASTFEILPPNPTQSITESAPPPVISLRKSPTSSVSEN